MVKNYVASDIGVWQEQNCRMTKKRKLLIIYKNVNFKLNYFMS